MRILIVIILLGFGSSAAGKDKLDSLKAVLKTNIADTSKVMTLNAIAKEYQKTSDYNVARHFAFQSAQLAEKCHFKRGMSRAYNTLGVVYWQLSSYDSSLVFFKKALNVRKELKDSSGIAGTLNNIGLVYSSKGDYRKVIEYYTQSLKIAEKLDDKMSIANTHNNIGLVHYTEGNYPAALESFYRALKMNEKLGDLEQVSLVLNNIASIHQVQGDFNSAIKSYEQSIQFAEKIGDKEGIAMCYSNLGVIYKDQKKFDQALKYQNEALALHRETGNVASIANAYSNLGTVNYEMGNYSKAYENLIVAKKLKSEVGDKYGLLLSMVGLADTYERTNKLDNALKEAMGALGIAKELDAPDLYKSCYHTLSNIYKKQGKGIEALDAYQKYIAYRDSLYNEENTRKSVRAAMNFEYEKKSTADSVKHAEEKRVRDAEINAQRAELKQEQFQRYALYGGMSTVLIFSGLLYNRFRTTRKQKFIIEEQKHIVEEKNKEILDSITYAKRIQQAVLKEEEHVSTHLPEHFILFKPKDIVSGDFYWSIEKDNYWYVAAADCTGHGVPGAFMSMLGVSFLNEIMSSPKVLQPNEVLDQLREKLLKEFTQGKEDKDGKIKDGMDISFARLDLKSKKLLWSGANNPLWIWHSSEAQLIEYKANKQPIGYHPEPEPFALTEVQLKEGDVFYLFSDGYADQFGGSKGKKLKYKPFQKLLEQGSTQPMIETKVVLSAYFNTWKGELEQTDDVCVIGVRV